MKIKGIGYIPGYALGKLFYLEDAIVQTDVSWIALLDEPSIEKVALVASSSPAGIIVVGSQFFSHSVIYLFSVGVPTVLIERELVRHLPQGVDIFIDGNSGLIYINPSKDEKRQLNTSNVSPPGNFTEDHVKVYTSDGIEVKLLASINSEKGAYETKKNGGSGIGLLRSELLFIDKKEALSENIIYKRINNVCDAAKPLPVTIRLFDLGGEKVFDWAPRVPDIGLTLGIRGSRLYFFDEFSDLLANQLKAISRILDSHEHKLSILIPFLSSVDDTQKIIQKITRYVSREKVEIGAMLETVSMSLSIAEITPKVDFLAIGTNDLSQSFFGVDRSSSLAARYYDLYSPSLLKLFSLIGADAMNCGVRVRVCGQLPLYPYWIQLLIGLGFREFSIEPSAIPTMKKLILRQRVSHLRNVTRQASSISVKERLGEFLRNEF